MEKVKRLTKFELAWAIDREKGANNSFCVIFLESYKRCELVEIYNKLFKTNIR